MLLVLSLRVEGHFPDIPDELLALSVNPLQHRFGDKLFVVELRDLQLLVRLQFLISVPRFAIDFLEEIPLNLAHLRLWQLMSLGQVKG